MLSVTHTELEIPLTSEEPRNVPQVKKSKRLIKRLDNVNYPQRGPNSFSHEAPTTTTHEFIESGFQDFARKPEKQCRSL